MNPRMSSNGCLRISNLEQQDQSCRCCAAQIPTSSSGSFCCFCIDQSTTDRKPMTAENLFLAWPL
jgi:hypothetical protein